MHAAWVGFATGGNPGWPAYDLDRRAAVRFDTTSEVVETTGSSPRPLGRRALTDVDGQAGTPGRYPEPGSTGAPSYRSVSRSRRRNGKSTEVGTEKQAKTVATACLDCRSKHPVVGGTSGQ